MRKTSALLIGAGLLLAASIARYDVPPLGNVAVVQLDRWTGEVRLLVFNEGTRSYPSPDLPWGSLSVGFILGVVVGVFVTRRTTT